MFTRGRNLIAVAIKVMTKSLSSSDGMTHEEDLQEICALFEQEKKRKCNFYVQPFGVKKSKKKLETKKYIFFILGDSYFLQLGYG